MRMLHCRRASFARTSLAVALALGSGWTGADEPQPESMQVTMECPNIFESSGVAASWRHEGILWTHNDSGDSPRLFAVDYAGRHVQEVEIRGAMHVDWEDMASYQIDGKPQLLIGDVGDNALRRKEVVCYRLNEPQLDSRQSEVDQIWRIRFPQGPRDCEAVAVDVREKIILLVSKVKGLSADVYSVPLETGKKEATVVAKRVASITMPLMTAMDIHPRGGRIIISTYADALLFHRQAATGSKRTDWQATFEQTPTLIRLPFRRQGEAVCFDRRDNAIWLTSEKKPAPLIRVPLPD